VSYDTDPIEPTDYPFGCEPHISGNIPQTTVTLQSEYKPFDQAVGADLGLTLDAVVSTLKSLPTKEISLLDFVPRGKFQDGVGACNIYTTGKAFQACTKMQGGPSVDVSYAAVYWDLNRTNDPGQGTLPEDSLKYMLEKGIPLASQETPELTQRRFNLTPAQRKDALKYRFNDAYLLNRNNGGLSACDAIMKGYLADGGIWWYDTDSYVSKDGRLPAVGRNIRSFSPGGHSVIFGSLKWFDEGGQVNAGGRMVNLESGLHIGFNNHHGDDECKPFTFPNGATVTPRWGLNGCGYIPMSRVTAGMKVFAWWALKDVFRFWGDLPTPTF